MEWFTILLSSLLTAISPIGLIIDTVVANTLREQIRGAEELAVRIDNTPSYQPIQGKIDRVRIASRGVELIDNLRIEAIELETDPIDLNIEQLQREGVKKARESLRKPFQGALHIIVKEADINKALQAPNVKNELQKLVNRFLPPQSPKFEILALHLEFMEKNRLGVQVQLKQMSEERETTEEEETEKIELSIEMGFKVEGGRKIQLFDLNGTLNGRKLSQRFFSLVTEGINKQLDLAIFEKQGVIARILNLNLDDNTLDFVGFIHVNPSSPKEP